ncbi:MAG: hypothetical protein AB1765_04375 [Candidatus Hydrogenedentota bacterium]
MKVTKLILAALGILFTFTYNLIATPGQDLTYYLDRDSYEAKLWGATAILNELMGQDLSNEDKTHIENGRQRLMDSLITLRNTKSQQVRK